MGNEILTRLAAAAGKDVGNQSCQAQKQKLI
jgi:hypothetical protein